MIEKQTKLFKALSDKNRIRILKMLEGRSLCACEITEVLELASSTVSVHLNILKNAGFIEENKDGKWINYSISKNISDPMVLSLLTAMQFTLKDDRIINKDNEKACTVNRLNIKKI